VEGPPHERNKSVEPLDLQVLLGQRRRGAYRRIDRRINAAGEQDEDGKDHHHLEKGESAGGVSHGS
jgi:hypothetical protein